MTEEQLKQLAKLDFNDLPRAVADDLVELEIECERDDRQRTAGCWETADEDVRLDVLGYIYEEEIQKCLMEEIQNA